MITITINNGLFILLYILIFAILQAGIIIGIIKLVKHFTNKSKDTEDNH